MTTQAITTQTVATEPTTITPLHGAAWAAYNASFHQPDGEPFRSLGHMLYQHALHQRIQDLFQHGDEQNARLDALLAGSFDAAHTERLSEKGGYAESTTPAA